MIWRFADANPISFILLRNIDYQFEHIRHKLKERIYFRNIDAMCASNREAEKILRLHAFEKPIFMQQVNGGDERLWYPRDTNKERDMGQEQDLLVGPILNTSPYVLGFCINCFVLTQNFQIECGNQRARAAVQARRPKGGSQAHQSFWGITWIHQ